MYKLTSPKINLSPFSKIKAVCTEGTEQTVKKVEECVQSKRDQVFDAGILAGLSFFGTLASTFVTGVSTETAILTALISSGSMFFTILAMKRGLVKEVKEEKTQ